MGISKHFSPKYRVKDDLHSETRKKLGLTQAQLAAMLGHSRAYITMAESKQRNLGSASNLLLTNMYIMFSELETGARAGYRSLETRLFLNDLYKQKLPEMTALEKDCRRRIKMLKNDMVNMKEKAMDAEHSIIVFTSAIKELQENKTPSAKTTRMITGLELFKRQTYLRLLSCWEPEQAKLQASIEALAGEAKALRRFRLKINREHHPFKK